MNYALQSITIPDVCVVLKHEFTTYDPVHHFTPENNLFYLTEDLFQGSFETANIIVDLGWYGNLTTNNGQFKLLVIQDLDWEHPIITKTSTSQSEIALLLQQQLNDIYGAYY